MSDSPEVVGFGPGAIHADDNFGWRAADVALDIEYLSHQLNTDTVAQLTLRAINIEDAADVQVSCEITEGDVLRVMEVLHAIHTALLEDKAQA